MPLVSTSVRILLNSLPVRLIILPLTFIHKFIFFIIALHSCHEFALSFQFSTFNFASFVRTICKDKESFISFRVAINERPLVVGSIVEDHLALAMRFHPFPLSHIEHSSFGNVKGRKLNSTFLLFEWINGICMNVELPCLNS